MQVKLKNVPKSWPRGASRNVTVSISEGRPNARCAVTLLRTTPTPKKVLGALDLNLDGSGSNEVVFTIALNAAGVSALYCEARTKTETGSDSKGTVVG